MRWRRALSGLVGAVMVATSVGTTLGVAVHDAPPAAADTFTDPGFVAETVATVPAFTLVGLTLAPGGRMFVWQKNGVVRIIKNGVLLPTPFIDVSSHVNTFDDRGFWGLALDPDYATNGFVYLSYTYEEAGSPNDVSPKTARLTRVTSNPTNLDVALPGETVILGSVGDPPCSAHPAGVDCIAADGGSHSLGQLQFLQDGTVLVGMGDGANAGPTDPLPLRAQELNSTNGKILCINKDGTAPPDNPFYNGTNSVRSKVWLYGVRNPFRFDVQPDTGDIWFGDVGWNTWEEVNHGTRGSNHGWPCWEGNEINDTYRTTATCATLQQSAVTMPYDTYNHSTGATAVIGGPFYNATAYPQQYRGNWFYADYTGNFIKRVVFDAAHNPVGIQTFATNVQAPVSLAVGPDGFIYYLSFTTGQIRRIRPSGPAAAAVATPRYGMSPLTVSFSSAGTTNGTQVNSSSASGAIQSSTDPLWIGGNSPYGEYFQGLIDEARVYNRALTATDIQAAMNAPLVAPPPDTTAPTAPGALTATTPSPTQVDLTWSAATDNVAVTGYRIERCAGVGCTNFAQVGTAATISFSDVGLAPGTSYSYQVRAVDGAANVSNPSNAATATTPNPDTTAPTAPTGLTATGGAGQITLTWSAATDNVAVAGYRIERCQGVGCTNFVQVASSTGTTYTDTGLTAATTYTYRARTVDTSGNLSSYSTTTSATTVDGTPGLVAGYAFDAGSGSTLVDVSGNGNDGTISGGTSWAAGKYGGALSFNGSTGRVSVPASPSLGLSSAMTLMAWIEPTANQNDWRTIMQRQPDAFFLNASNSTGPLRPAGGGTVGGGITWVGGPTASPVNAWTHVALTYDGSTMRLYVNGTQVNSSSASGAIQSSTDPLWIGGNSPYGEYFQGLIDEARVYNRALTATDIQAAMNAPLN